MRVEVGVIAVLAAVMCLTQLSAGVSADATTGPTLYSPIPANGSYVAGGDRPFYVAASAEDLDTATVALHIKSAEATGWDKYSMTCSVIAVDTWNCTATVSLNIVGSDTKETYYFTANDTFGNSGSLGSAQEPLTFTVDINRPLIEFTNPLNNTYVSGTELLTVRATDASSGVNNATVAYSLDNSSWTAMAAGADSLYTVSWPTAAYANNQTLTLYAKATDRISNTGYGWIRVQVDNEYPIAAINAPSAGQQLTGVVKMGVNASDSYSGVNTSAVYLTFGGQQKLLGCAQSPSGSGYICEFYFDTTQLTDGTYTASFNVSDNAGNSVVKSVQATTYNKETRVSVGMSNGSYVRGVAIINASVANPMGAVSGVQLKVTGPAGSGYISTSSMACYSTFSLCNLTIDTTQLPDAQYTLVANVTNTEGKLISSAVSAVVDNMQPLMAIDSPASTVVSETIYPKVVVTDENGVAEGSVSFSLSGYSYVMTCSAYVSGKKFVCGGNFDTRLISDNYYPLTFYASDLAGNMNTARMTVLVDNVEGVGPSPNETTTTTQTASAATTTTTAPGQPSTPTTAPPSLWESWTQNSDSPVSVLVWNAQKAFDSTFNTWPLKAFAISMIVFLVVLAVFRTSQVRKVFEKKQDAGMQADAAGRQVQDELR
jgi:hypothetical protein